MSENNNSSMDSGLSLTSDVATAGESNNSAHVSLPPSPKSPQTHEELILKVATLEKKVENLELKNTELATDNGALIKENEVLRSDQKKFEDFAAEVKIIISYPKPPPREFFKTSDELDDILDHVEYISDCQSERLTEFVEKIKGIDGYKQPPMDPPNIYAEFDDALSYLQKFVQNLKENWIRKEKVSKKVWVPKSDPKGKFGCQICKLRYTLLCSLRTHMAVDHEDPSFFLEVQRTCVKCGYPFKKIGDFNKTCKKSCSGPKEAVSYFQDDSPLKGYYFFGFEAESEGDKALMDVDVSLDESENTPAVEYQEETVNGSMDAVDENLDDVKGLNEQQNALVGAVENASNVQELSSKLGAQFSGVGSPRVEGVSVDVGVNRNGSTFSVELEEEDDDYVDVVN